MKPASNRIMPSRPASLFLPFLLGLSGHTLPAMAQSTGTFAAAGNMTTARFGHTATLLLDGRVLIAGGDDGRANPIASTELYDPSTGTFTAAGDLNTARSFHTATLLSDGRVLIAGGLQAIVNRSLASAELYDPSTGTFTATGDMTTACFGHTATLLHNGQVLLAAGNSNGNPGDDFALCSTEVYDPATGTFTATGSMTTVQFGPTATLLADGTVLVASRNADFSPAIPPATSEIYDPFTGAFSRNGEGDGLFVGHTATLLPGGKVLLAGGSANSGVVLASAALYDPASGMFAFTGRMSGPRNWHAASLLPDGTVLIAGGTTSLGPLKYAVSAELYNPLTGAFSPTGEMTTGRLDPRATVLHNGDVLITGGVGINKDLRDEVLASAELYHPFLLSPAPGPADNHLR